MNNTRFQTIAPILLNWIEVPILVYVGHKLAVEIDTLAVVRIFQDSYNKPRVAASNGRAENPPRAVAKRIGANPTNAIYSNVGGNTPQKLINEMAERISQGDVSVALLTGSEAIRTAQLALRNNIDLNWQEEEPGSQEDRGIGEALASAHEIAHGLIAPIHAYPLFENAIRKERGRSVEEHLLAMGELFAPFTDVAADNPFSFYGTRRSAIELATVTKENRFICFPYPKFMNSRDSVNQGAAVVMTSVGKAKQLGIDPSKWVFLHGCSEANEKLLISDRVNLHSSPAIAANSAHAFAMAGKTLKDIDLIDIYSCFPSAVEVACDALGLSCSDPRGLTLTGGLPFFGGPGNNYSMHAIATAMPLLRADPQQYALITANGGRLSKHATGIYSATPIAGEWRRESSAKIQAQINAMPSPKFTETPSGAAKVETYTVCFDRTNPVSGIVIGRLLETDQRFIANTAIDATTLQQMMQDDFLNCSGAVVSSGGMNTFTAA
ncbi:MAG: acetyl-CoA acetyltransferase [Robiginitomaculum sp.]|nr:acetyl-CoA acetyltransferase [Robiginitomaculum sp.]